MDKTVFKNILQFLIILIFNSFLAQEGPKKVVKATIINDTISKKDTIAAPKESLDAVVDYKADDIRRDVGLSAEQTRDIVLQLIRERKELLKPYNAVR